MQIKKINCLSKNHSSSILNSITDRVKAVEWLSVQKFQNLVPINCHLRIFMLSYQLIWGNSRGGGVTNVTNACSLLNSNERTGWGVILIKNASWEQNWIGTWLTIKICIKVEFVVPSRRPCVLVSHAIPFFSERVP